MNELLAGRLMEAWADQSAPRGKERTMPDTLTREQILSLSGPALSVAVAERVMGWFLPTDPAIPRAWLKRELMTFAAGSPCAPYESEVWAGWWAEPAPLLRTEYGDDVIDPAWALAGSAVWAPHKDIAAAWEVVEKLRADRHRLRGAAGLWVELETVQDSDGPHDTWRAVVYSPMRHGSAYAATAPESISRAALLAVSGG